MSERTVGDSMRLGAADLEAIARQGVVREFTPRTVLVTEGDETDALYIILEGQQFVPERLTQADIASRVGCSREMVSRIFKDLVQGRYISLEPDRIVINRKPPAHW